MTMVFEPGPVWAYYLFRGHVERQDDVQFEDLDADMITVRDNLNERFRGEARDFKVELDFFDEESGDNTAEIIVGFIIYPYEDEEEDFELILKEVTDELENIGFITDDIEFLGESPGYGLMKATL